MIKSPRAKTISVADEDQHIRSLLCILFEKDLASDPEEAIKRYTKKYPSIMKFSKKNVVSIAYNLNMYEEVRILLVEHHFDKENIIVEVLAKRDIDMLHSFYTNNILDNYVLNVDDVHTIFDDSDASKYTFKLAYIYSIIPMICKFPHNLLYSFSNQMLDIINTTCLIEKWLKIYGNYCLVDTHNIILDKQTKKK